MTMAVTDADMMIEPIRLSERAARRVAFLAAQEGRKLRLRLTVSGGGCSGFQYGFSLDPDAGDDDLIFATGAGELVVDAVSLDLLRGSEVDFVEDLGGSYFQVKNPNAVSSCGCGTSFAIA